MCYSKTCSICASLSYQTSYLSMPALGHNFGAYSVSKLFARAFWKYM